jgi:two-component system, LytTR family, response regulator
VCIIVKINCIIVEDEPLALARTKNYVLRTPALQLLQTFSNGPDTLRYLATHTVQLIFLDINLGELTGIQMLENTAINSQVIFTTAYHEYALKGYELNVTDYLLKPFTFERFTQAVCKVQERIVEKNTIANKAFIFIRTENRLEKLFLEDVLYIEGMRDYRKIHTIHKRIMTLQTFRELEQEILPVIICRVHKSFMVGIGKIDAVERDGVRVGERIIPVSETYRKRFIEVIDNAKGSGKGAVIL